jgi:hypothetical protein
MLSKIDNKKTLSSIYRREIWSKNNGIVAKSRVSLQKELRGYESQWILATQEISIEKDREINRKNHCFFMPKNRNIRQCVIQKQRLF